MSAVKGKFIGQLRRVTKKDMSPQASGWWRYNIIEPRYEESYFEQWDGNEWVRVEEITSFIPKPAATTLDAEVTAFLNRRHTIIAAVDDNMLIGNGDQLPWKNKEDMKFFKETTMGHPVIMGRKTFESIGKRALPGRRNIVLSRSDFSHPDVLHATDLSLVLAALTEEAFIIGGAQVYEQALENPLVNRMYLTRIPGEHEGDTFFPSFDKNVWKLQETRVLETCTIETWMK